MYVTCGCLAHEWPDPADLHLCICVFRRRGLEAAQRLLNQALPVHPLLTEREQDFFWRLREAVGNDLVIAPQVVFGAFIKVKATAMTDKNHARHVVAHNRCDFLLCDKKLKPVALVEVDDSTHNSSKAKAKDRRRDELMKAVGYPCIDTAECRRPERSART